MAVAIHNPIPPGTMVRVEQRVARRESAWTTIVEGEVLSHELEPTGSWFVRGKRDKLWLPRLRLKKTDGEITTVNLDHLSTVTLLKPAS